MGIGQQTNPHFTLNSRRSGCPTYQNRANFLGRCIFVIASHSGNLTRQTL